MFEILNPGHAFPDHPYFHEYILDDLLGQFRGLGDPVDITRQQLVPLPEQAAKGSLVTRRDTRKQVLLIIWQRGVQSIVD